MSRHLAVAAICVVLAAVPVTSEWTAWGSPACYREQQGFGQCIYREYRRCLCTMLDMTCACEALQRRYIGSPRSAEFCTSDCHLYGTWCPWGSWAAVGRSRCRLLAVRSRQCCPAGSVIPSVPVKRCTERSNSSASESRVHVIINCSTFSSSGLAGLFGTAVVVLSAIAAAILFRLRHRRRRTNAAPSTRCPAYRGHSDGPFVVGPSPEPVLPPRYEDCVGATASPPPPPPPYELAIVEARTAAERRPKQLGTSPPSGPETAPPPPVTQS